MSLDALAQSLVFGILVGALYGLAAVGLSLVFGVLKVLNVAHGELLMIGGYASFWMFSVYHIDPFVSLLITIPILFIIGVALHRGLFVRVVKFGEDVRIKNSLLIAFGLALVLQNLAMRFWTADERSITTSYSGATTILLGVSLPYVRVGNLVFGLAAIIALHLFLTRTYTGRSIVATAEDWEAASLVGINIDRTYLLAFAIGTALAGAAGTLVAVGYSVDPGIGLQWTLKALVVIILAGMGSVGGTFAGGVLLGAIESVSVSFIGGSYREVVGLVMFLLVLLLRPEGLFGRKSRSQ
ncbi:MAG: branched-chain amino acid ABC transporter permease [Chloroflexi bacterium]|nr:branched-chain amino acid ABC transporter permease [Chloroflexota bacterium]